MIAGLLVATAGTAPLAAAAAGSGGVDISAGGPAAAPYVADEDFTGGATSATTHAITTTGLTDPAPQSVYQHNRYGNFTYTIPGLTAGGSYTVRLHFAEEYWTTAGSRTFNVLINGTQVLTDFDIFATAGGEYIAVIEPFTATASSTGTITIQFVTVKDNAQVNGIEIVPSGGTGANTVSVTGPGNQTGTAGTAASLQVSGSDSASGQTLTYTATRLPAGLSINSGTGEPPSSFWGNTSAIPAATNVLEISVVNQTNGQYPDTEVHWSFNGQTESIAEQPYIDMPANSAGRMYFYLGTPNGPYYDFIEFTVGASSINVDTTRVDRFGLKLALLLHGHDGSNQEVGEDYATFQESRAATFQRFENFVPTQFKELATDAHCGIPSPGNDPAFQAGGAYANYFTSYAAANGDTTDSTAQIFGCGGTLAANPTLCAALNRHVAQLPASEQSNPANFYQAAPANYYAEFWHENAINGLQYGFPYDDDGQSSDISVTNPQYMVVAVGW
jgi:Malectin domain/Beta-1,3-glucanase/Putative Ig domain